MNPEIFSLCKNIVSYATQGQQSRRQREKQIQALISNRRLPEDGWDDVSIELFLAELASMDSNNFVDNIGVGEREARIFSEIVSKRNFRLGHGIGRSGDIAAVQPKAAGSALLNKLANIMALSAIRIGIPDTADSLILPMATGMGIVLSLIALKEFLGKGPECKYVLWPRIDQKTCLKAVVTAGFNLVIIENVLEGDEVRTDLNALEAKITELGAENIFCILTTSSCFAPRAPDKIIDISKLCKQHNIAHVINNAYGIQTESTCQQITKAARVGRVDCFVQSTDKNFMVPVGGSIVASFDAKFIEILAKTYPGRASSSPIIDLFLTLLSMGSKTFKRLRREQSEFLIYFKERIRKVAEDHGEKLLETPNNPISFGMTLNNFSLNERGCSYFGSMLFQRHCSGTRTVPLNAKKEICGFSFTGYGAHMDDYPYPYLCMASAIGIEKQCIDDFVKRLEKTIQKFQKQKQKLRNESPKIELKENGDTSNNGLSQRDTEGKETEGKSQLVHPKRSEKVKKVQRNVKPREEKSKQIAEKKTLHLGVAFFVGFGLGALLFGYSKIKNIT